MNLKSEISKKISTLARNGDEFLFVIDFLADNAFVYSPEEAFDSGIFYDFNGISNYKKIELPLIKQSFEFDPVSFQVYSMAYNKVQRALQRGDTYLLNLTFKTPLKSNYKLEDIFAISKAPYKLFVKDKFVVFSPELFVKIQNGRISTHPMKGTIDAGIVDAEKQLMENEKEVFEHNTIVDLLRNDLNIVAENVVVENFRYVDKIVTNRGELLQISSKISGDIRKEYKDSLGELLFKLLPVGSVTGAPKQRTIEHIFDAENYNRGFYTGVFGYFNGDSLETAVSIRFIEKEGEELFYKSGGGITAMSNPEDEYEEMLDKIYVPVF
jgi:para-aminobenzoate synthetase component 1